MYSSTHTQSNHQHTHTCTHREDTAKLGPNYVVSLDPFFEAEKDLQEAHKSDAERPLEGVPIQFTPQAANARRWEVSLQAGQVGCNEFLFPVVTFLPAHVHT